jgi:hypothetical protein
MGERRGTCRILVGKPEGKGPRGRTGNIWKNDIEVDLQEIEWGAWFGLIWLKIGAGGGL